MLINLQDATIGVAGKPLLSHVDFHVEEGEFVYLIGAVGAGKSTLLRTLYGDVPLMNDEGTATVLNYDLHKLKRKQLPALRRQMGLVFQDFQLLADRTVHDNIDFVLRATGWKKTAVRRQRIEEVLEEVGLAEKASSFPHQLSGGEQQRISVARALINKPPLILADEPTGNLDVESTDKVMVLLRSLCERGTAVVMVTHNLALLDRYKGIVYHCQDGTMNVETGATAPSHTEPAPLPNDNTSTPDGAASSLDGAISTPDGAASSENDKPSTPAGDVSSPAEMPSRENEDK